MQLTSRNGYNKTYYIINRRQILKKQKEKRKQKRLEKRDENIKALYGVARTQTLTAEKAAKALSITATELIMQAIHSDAPRPCGVNDRGETVYWADEIEEYRKKGEPNEQDDE